MTSLRVRRTVRISALYDLVVTAGFALLFTAPALFDAFGVLQSNLGLPGVVPDAGDPFTVMVANLMGSLVVVWAVFRLARPTRAAGAADTAGRTLFSIGMAEALLHGASPLVFGMLILEVLWAVVQGAVVASARRPVMASGRHVRIAELARRAGVTVSTARFYERSGVLAGEETGSAPPAVLRVVAEQTAGLVDRQQRVRVVEVAPGLDARKDLGHELGVRAAHHRVG